MGDRTKIEWCNATFNPWLGCTRVSPGCDHCYAERLALRMGVGWGPHAERRLASDAYWEQPHRWARKARQTGIRLRVFCASMADVFDNQVPQEWRMRLWRLIWDTPELEWLILTKRPENIDTMLPADWLGGWSHVGLGISAEDQERFDHRWPHLRRIKAAFRFVSYEPALGPLDIMGTHVAYGLDWLICGGESGHGYRPMEAIWEGSIREQCRVLGIAYFFKQMAGKKQIPADFPLVRQFPQAEAKRIPPQFEMFEDRP
jgi:protein gp37